MGAGVSGTIGLFLAVQYHSFLNTKSTPDNSLTIVNSEFERIPVFGCRGLARPPEAFCIRTAKVRQEPCRESSLTETEMRIALPDGSKLEIAEDGASIEVILKNLGINPEEVIVAKNGKIVSEEETAGGSDELKIVRFVHGG